jgi:hypothetical protein
MPQKQRTGLKMKKTNKKGAMKQMKKQGIHYYEN